MANYAKNLEEALKLQKEIKEEILDCRALEIEIGKHLQNLAVQYAMVELVLAALDKEATDKPVSDDMKWRP